MPVPLFSMALTLWVIGCEKEVSDSGLPLPSIGDEDTESECPGGTAPIIDHMAIENGGTVSNGDDSWLSVNVALDISDADADIHNVRVEVWYDETVDDAIDTSIAPDAEFVGTLDSSPCSTPSGSMNNYLEVGGGGPAYNTVYEFGAIVIDANGLSSELTIASGSTPKEDGSDGDGSG